MQNDVGNKIRGRRNELKLSQKAVADYIGVSQQAYSKYESGLASFNFETALKLGEILDISLDEMGLNYRQQEKQDLTCSPEEAKLIGEYRKLDFYGKQLVNAVVEIEAARCTTISVPSAARSPTSSGANSIELTTEQINQKRKDISSDYN